MHSKVMRQLCVAAVAFGLTACAQVPSHGATNPAGAGGTDVVAIPTESAFGSYLDGGIAERDHAYGAAADYLDRALNDDPDNVDLLRRTFLLHLSEGSLQRATELARRLAPLDPHNGLPGLVLLIDQLKSGDVAGASAAAEALPDQGLLRAAA